MNDSLIDPRYRTFLTLGEADFPAHLDAYTQLWPSVLLHLDQGLARRQVERAFERFFAEHSPSWPRYQAYLDHWQLADPDAPLDEGDEDDDDTEDSMPTAESRGALLLHRIVSAIFMTARRVRYLEDVSMRPAWRLMAIADGNAYPDCVAESATAHRFDSAYWQTKKLPCERLFCRCEMQAFTEREAAERGAA